MVTEANVIVVEHRRAPKNHLPIATRIHGPHKWITFHSSGGGSENWLNKHADFDSMFVAGDSVDVKMAQQMVNRERSDWERGEGKFREGGFELWTTTTGPDKLVNPNSGPDLGRLGCSTVVVAVAEKEWGDQALERKR
ncbi:unnamed protein product [Linum tenue]|uniref:Uncharacterized protein n=1 Tax=Linum tenue TaxID=586396 RepID=A0AAV0RHZ7_9ROSI|nr:unnamed protein product [Linum tenue]